MPGRLILAILGCREGNLGSADFTSPDTAAAAEGRVGGVSVLGVGVATTLSVLGAVFLMGESVVPMLGVPGRDTAAEEGMGSVLTIALPVVVDTGAGVLVSDRVGRSIVLFNAAPISSLPGCCFFLLSLVVPGLGARLERSRDGEVVRLPGRLLERSSSAFLCRCSSICAAVRRGCGGVLARACCDSACLAARICAADNEREGRSNFGEGVGSSFNGSLSLGVWRESPSCE